MYICFYTHTTRTRNSYGGTLGGASERTESSHGMRQRRLPHEWNTNQEWMLKRLHWKSADVIQLIVAPIPICSHAYDDANNGMPVGVEG